MKDSLGRYGQKGIEGADSVGTLDSPTCFKRQCSTLLIYTAANC